jgi:membrane protein implicated in regulation of membrane protease activity
MIAIAGGILLTILILCLLPYIILAISFTFTVAIALAIAFVAGWLVWAGYQSPGGLAIELSIGGIFLIWLFYEIKARRQALPQNKRPNDQDERRVRAVNHGSR